jgi:hypothetical protein
LHARLTIRTLQLPASGLRSILAQLSCHSGVGTQEQWVQCMLCAMASQAPACPQAISSVVLGTRDGSVTARPSPGCSAAPDLCQAFTVGRACGCPLPASRRAPSRTAGARHA